MRRPLCGLACLYALFIFALVQILQLPTRPIRSDTIALEEGEQRPLLLTGTVRDIGLSGAGEKERRVLLQRAVTPDGCSVGDRFYVEAWVAEEETERLLPGMEVTMRGKLSLFLRATNPGEYDEALYKRIQHIRARFSDAEILHLREGRGFGLRRLCYRLRRQGVNNLRRCMGTGEAEILAAMLFGERGGLEEDLRDLYRATGIMHILAISGLHISVLGMGLYRLLRKGGLTHSAAAGGAAAFLVAYAFLTGGSPSAVRAVIMFLLQMAAKILLRSYDMLTGVALAGLVLLTFEPLYILHTGFLFSFAAVLGIGLLAPHLPGPLAARASLGATLGTLPVTLWNYGVVPPFAVVLNLAVLPLMPFVLAGGLVPALLGGLPGGSILCLPICLSLRGLLEGVRLLCRATAALPGAVFIAGAPGKGRVALYLLLLVGFVWRWEGDKSNKKTAARGAEKEEQAGDEWKKSLVLGLALLILLFHPPQQAPRLIMLDVGQGDGFLLSSRGRHWMIDGGSSSRSRIGERVLLPALCHLGVREIAGWVVTHADEDHCGGLLEILEAMEEKAAYGVPRIRAICVPAVAELDTEETWLSLRRLAAAQNIPIYPVGRGEGWTIGEFAVTCLHPVRGESYEDSNAASVTLLAKTPQAALLLTGDLENAAEEEVAQLLKEEATQKKEEAQAQNQGAPLRILKVGHHGSRNSTKEALLEAFPADLALVSAGRRNRYGHPHPETLARLASADARLLATPEAGAVTLRLSPRSGVSADTFLRGDDAE